MWKRLAEARLRQLSQQFPAVLILGARQVGKTTLARAAFPKAAYCDLEDPTLRHLFTEEPAFQLERRDNARGLILDEAQSVPSVFAALRGFIDRDRKRNGRFLLLGSAHPSLIRQVSESLAGRVGILDLDPFTVSEVAGKSPRRALHDLSSGAASPTRSRGISASGGRRIFAPTSSGTCRSWAWALIPSCSGAC